MNTTAATKPKNRKTLGKSRTWWLKQFHTWHWVSAALTLLMMTLFAITGITLNHAAIIGATPTVTTKGGTLPAPLRAKLVPTPAAPDAPLPADVAAGITQAVGVDAAGRPGEWSEGEVYVALPRAGGDGWVSVDRATGKISAEITDRGWISWANDLHKGRNTGAAWNWFIDVFAAICILFTLTGLVLLQMNARFRPKTWPVVGIGLGITILFAIFFSH